MPTQTNRLVLVESDPTTGMAGMQRTLSTSDSLAFSLDSFDVSSQGAQLSSGGSTLDVQAPYIYIGTESSGGEANVETHIGHSTSAIIFDGQLYFDAPLYMRGSELGLKFEAGEELSAGDVLAVDGSANPASPLVPRFVRAETDAADEDEREFAGIVTTTYIASGDFGYAATVAGSVAACTFKVGDTPSAGSEGQAVYVSTDLGKAQMTAPNQSGQTVYRIGFLTSTTAISGNKYGVLLAPQLIGRIP